MLQLWIFFATMDLSDKWRLIDEERKDHSGYQNKHIYASSYFYTILCIFSLPLYRRGLWLGSELVGPFSLVIGFLAEFFSPGNGTASIQEFFYHYLLYYELFSFVIILFSLYFLGEGHREECLINLGFVKRNWLKYLVWGS